MNRISLSGAACLLVLAGTWSLAPAQAKEPTNEDTKAGARARPDKPGQSGQGKSSAAQMPDCLKDLKLSPEQQTQIEGIVQEYDEDIDSVWAQFRARYRATIQMECSLLCAIEDDLTEAQRTQVRAQRRKVAQHEKVIAGTKSKPNQATSKPADAVQEEIGLTGVSLTAEQETAADKVQEKYLNHLRSMNRDIQGLHTRLVSLEADKMVEIEKVLTKPQMLQLREHRQTAPVEAKEHVSVNDSK